MNERYNKIFHSIDSNQSIDDSRAEMIRFLKKESVALKENNEQSIAIAYGIAGFLGTEFARQLEDSDPISEVLIIAGELEINPDNADQLREELIQKIDNL